jgi:hypothetical protein
MKDDIYDIPMVYLLYVLLAVVAIVAVAVIVIIRMLQAPLRRILIERQHDSRIDRALHYHRRGPLFDPQPHAVKNVPRQHIAVEPGDQVRICPPPQTLPGSPAQRAG